MVEPGYRTHRYVLRPDCHWQDVGRFADSLSWPLVQSSPRDQTAGIDGQMIWQSPDGVSIHYVIDATAGIGYVTLAGPDQATVSPFAASAASALAPWTLGELVEEFDRNEDFVERGRLTLRIGLAAPAAFDADCFRCIQRSLADADPRIRLAAVWAASYTGYGEFLPLVRAVADSDPEAWLRARAASVADAFEAASSLPDR